MKILKYIIGLILVGLTFASTAMAVNVTVPQSPADGSVLFGNANGTYNSSTTPLMINKTSNYVGIGTTTPIGRLTIQGMNNLSTGIPLSVFNASGTPVLVATNAGNVGIGTTTPGTQLHIENSTNSSTYGVYPTMTFSNPNIVGNSYAAMSFINGNVSQLGVTGLVGQLLTNALSNASQYMWLRSAASTYPLYLGNGATQTMTILNGRVGISTTSPVAYSKLDIQGTYNVFNQFDSQLHLHTDNNQYGMFLGSHSSSYGVISQGSVYYVGGQYTALTSTPNILEFKGGDFKFLSDFGRTVGSTYTPTPVMIIKNGGNVGIGTTSPQSKLEVSKNMNLSYPNIGTTPGSIHISPTAISNGQSVGITFGATNAIGIQDGAQAGIYAQYSGSYGTKLYFATTNDFPSGSQARMMIDSLGNVGIGTTSPTRLLHVVNATNPSIAVQTTGSTGAASHYSLNDGAGAVEMTIYGSAAASTRYGVNKASLAMIEANSATNFVIGTQGAVPLLFGTNGSERMRIDNTGNFGIATTTPNAKLHVYGNVALKYTLIPLASTTYTVATSTDNIVYVATTTAATTINLPACIGTTDQVIYSFKDKGGAAGTQNITITATAGDTLDGAATKIINTAYGSTKVQCVSGSGWFVLP